MPPSSSDRVLDQVGLNIIRIIIGSYFMAVSLDIVKGVRPDILLRPFMSNVQADLVGSSVLLLLSVLVMAGVCLRLAALSLALFVFSSSLLENFTTYAPENLSHFWRDVTLICAVILSYGNLDRAGLRRASALRPLMHASRNLSIRPRRVTPGLLRKRPVQQDLREAYLALETFQRTGSIAPTEEGDGETPTPSYPKPRIVHG